MDRQEACSKYPASSLKDPYMASVHTLRQYFLGRLGPDAIEALRDVTGCSHVEATDFLSGDMADVDTLRDSVNENARVARWEELCNFHEDAKEFVNWFERLQGEDADRVVDTLKDLQVGLKNVLTYPKSLVKECDPELERLLAEEDAIAQCPECGLKDAHVAGCNTGIEARSAELVQGHIGTICCHCGKEYFGAWCEHG